MDNMAMRNLTYVIAIAAQVKIELTAMQEANLVARDSSKQLPYTEDDFRKLIDIHGLNHNAVLSMEWGY